MLLRLLKRGLATVFLLWNPVPFRLWSASGFVCTSRVALMLPLMLACTTIFTCMKPSLSRLRIVRKMVQWPVRLRLNIRPLVSSWLRSGAVSTVRVASLCRPTSCVAVSCVPKRWNSEWDGVFIGVYPLRCVNPPDCCEFIGILLKAANKLCVAVCVFVVVTGGVLFSRLKVDRSAILHVQNLLAD